MRENREETSNDAWMSVRREAIQLRCQTILPNGHKCNKLLAYVSGTDFCISFRCSRCKQSVHFSRSPRELAVAR